MAKFLRFLYFLAGGVSIGLLSIVPPFFMSPTGGFRDFWFALNHPAIKLGEICAERISIGGEIERASWCLMIAVVVQYVIISMIAYAVYSFVSTKPDSGRAKTLSPGQSSPDER